jgi:RNA polymerase sigma factor (sigma-70 family)
MAADSVHRVIRHLRRAVLLHEAAGLTDGALLEQYVARRDEAAFAALLRRHGPMVLGVCRRVLHNEADAEDAFQATFLVLVRKAASIRSRGAVSNWLYGVAHNTARKAKAMNSKRRTREREAGAVPRPEAAEEVWREVQALLDRELNGLPEKYRVPIVLCDLEGTTIKEAARHLGWPQGTVATRLTRGRALLARRLTQHGLVLSGGALAAVLSPAAAASVPPTLFLATVKAAGLWAAGRAATGSLPAKVIALTEGMVQAMFLSKIKLITAAVLVAAAVAGGLAYRLGAAEEAAPRAAGAAGAAPKTELLTLRGWGTTLDPAGDCKFTLEKDKLTITVPGSDHALCIERGQMNAPRVLQDVEGDFILQVKVSGDYPAEATSVVEKRTAFHGAGLLLWQDEKNYIRLEKARLNSNGAVGYVSWELREDGEFARVGDTRDAPTDAKEVYLRLERRDGKVFGSLSADGNQWTALEPMAVELPKKVKVGVVAGQNTSTGFAPEFSEFKLYREAAR